MYKMTNSALRGCIIVAGLLTMIFPLVPAFCDTKNLDVVLLLDSSGSMLITDPLNLRSEGIGLFVELLGEHDRVSLIAFDEKPTIIVPLNGRVDRDGFTRSLKSIQTKGEYTDIGLAFEMAAQTLRKNGRDDSEKIIVLLSDGKFEPHPIRGQAEELKNALVEKVVPSELSNGIRTFALAFSLEADRGLLENISSKGGGLFWYTPTSEKIHESFADLLLAAKRPQITMMGEHGFFIDELVEEATFYVTKELGAQVTLVAPDNHRYHGVGDIPNIRWYRGKNFEVMTIKEPMAGSWRVVGANLDDGYATLLTKLSLDTKWPTFVVAEEPTKIEANLMEGEKPLALSSMSALLTMKVQVSSNDKISEPIIEANLRDDGQHGDSSAQDGVYSAYLALPEHGRYRLKVIAESPTFEREQLLPFEVESQNLSLSRVTSKELGEVLGTSPLKKAHEREEGDNFLIKIEAPQGLKGVVVTLTAKTKNKSTKMSLQKNKSGDLFFGSANELKPGKYKLQAELKANMKGRGAIHQRSSILTFNKEEIVEVKDIPEEKSPEEKPHKEVEPEADVADNSIPLTFLSLLNLGVLGFFMFLIKNKFGTGMQGALPPGVPHETLSMLVEIEKLASRSEVDFFDPRYRKNKPSESGGLSSQLSPSPEKTNINENTEDNVPEPE